MNGDAMWERQKQAERILDEFEQACQSGPIPPLREWMLRHSGLRDLVGRELLKLDVEYRRRSGALPSAADYADLPAEWVAAVLADSPSQSMHSAPSGSRLFQRPRATDPTLPEGMGGFEVLDRLGRGGFGEVYLAYDPSLDRLVAIKVPRDPARQKLDGEWTREARIVARLDHPHIVPVYHVGTTPEFPVFIVSKYIDGCSLAERIRQSPLALAQVVDFLIDVADALDYAHHAQAGVVHRDIKPGNLLLDQSDKIYIADFGLAQRETDLRLNESVEGTPAYMSPEQARGEGHRVDGRSDLFSLGIVLYELSVGQKPFNGRNSAEVLEQIKHAEPRSLCALNRLIPAELERICLKALAKRAAERYDTVGEFAAELRQLRNSGLLQPVARQTLGGDVAVVETPPQAGLSTAESAKTSGEPPGLAAHQPIPLGTKGLRAFEAEDAELFLELLPGLRDREGLPESIRFWKLRIEQTDPLRTFSVGVLTGSSGCGKSSLIKAGLLPRLSDRVVTISLEATSDQTESDLLQRLHRRIPRLKENRDLASCLTAVRREWAGLGRRKLLLVIDQFEQWLHAHQGEATSALAEALRQCDGQHLQCLLLVRDDYAMGVFRFLKQLEIPLVQGQNSAVVDRFDLPHAARVLTSFGRAMGTLSSAAGPLEPRQQQFIDQAIASLAEQNQVVPVRLALFAEMFRHRPWTPESLLSVGGAEGVGRVFLEETFRSDSAPPQYRVHAQAAQRMLAALLPDAGADIMGHWKSQPALVAAAGYRDRPQDASELLRILDSELRLISPVETGIEEDHVVEAAAAEPVPASSSADRRYHLAHDYLVPSLRRWLEDILGSTSEGRAKLLLRERSRLWNDRPLHRHLPSFLEHLRIRRWVPTTERSAVERKMLRQAAKVHGGWTGLTLVGMLCLAMGAGWFWQDRRQREAVAQVQVLESAVASDWTRTFDTLRSAGLVHLAERPLRERLDAAQAGGDTIGMAKMRAGLLVTQEEKTQVAALTEALLTLPVAEFAVVRELLPPYADASVTSEMWNSVEDEKRLPAQQRFQGAVALARLTPDDARWPALAPFIARHLTSLPAAELVAWRPLLEPIRTALTPEVARLVVQPKVDPILRRSAAETLVDYARDNGLVVAEALLDSDPATFEVLWRVAARNSEQAIQRLEQELALPSPPGAGDDDLEKLHIRQSRAAAGLVRLDRADKVWPKLVFDPQPSDPQSQDPSLRTEVLHALAEYRVPWQKVVDRLKTGFAKAQHAPRDVRETSIQRSLLMALGGYTGRLSAEIRTELIEQLRLHNVFHNDPDPGIHSACELLLRRWAEKRWLDTAQTELRDLKSKPPTPSEGEPRRWFVNSQKQTFVVFPPGVFLMGSPIQERGRIPQNEQQHRRQIERAFAIAATEVTRADYTIFAMETHNKIQNSQYSNTSYDPYTRVRWVEAAQYCNWLSRKDSLTECYFITGTGSTATVTMKPTLLGLDGYRLPFEAEWEFACRSGVIAAWGHGRADRRLGQYAWFLTNSNEHLWPVGRLLPNEAGLFDMSGNAAEWCQDRAMVYPNEDRDHPTQLDNSSDVDMSSSRMLRGGSYSITSTVLRAADRYNDRPDVDDNYISFRPVRTYLEP